MNGPRNIIAYHYLQRLMMCQIWMTAKISGPKISIFRRFFENFHFMVHFSTPKTPQNSNFLQPLRSSGSELCTWTKKIRIGTILLIRNCTAKVIVSLSFLKLQHIKSYLKKEFFSNIFSTNCVCIGFICIPSKLFSSILICTIIQKMP